MREEYPMSYFEENNSKLVVKKAKETTPGLRNAQV